MKRSLYPLVVCVGLVLAPLGAEPVRGQEPAGDPIPLKNWVPATMHVTPERHRSPAPPQMSEAKWMSQSTDAPEGTSVMLAQPEESTLSPQSVDQTSAIPFSYYNIAGSTLQPRDSATSYDYTSTGCIHTVAGTDRILNTQLQLPDGAIIKYLRIFYNDTNASTGVKGYITRYDAGSATEDLTSVSSVGSGGTGTQLSAEITHEVDNFGWAYVLIGWPDANSTQNQICGLRVAYYPPATGAFHPLAPCRIADTRPGSGFTGQFGGPALSAGVARPMDLKAGACSIPAEAIAVSLNVTVTQTQGPGDLRVYPNPGSAPLVSTLNYVGGQTVANAAVVPLGTSGVNFLPAVSGTHLVLDVNGYFY